jgi:signal peptidase I
LEPKIKSGATVVVDKNYYNCHEVERNDVVIYRHTGNDNPLIKIVKAVPGDSFAVEDSKLYVNGEPIKNSEGSIYRFSNIDMLELYEDSMNGKMDGKVYFIFGDTPGSLSSEKFGPATRGNISGKVVEVK